MNVELLIRLARAVSAAQGGGDGALAAARTLLDEAKRIYQNVPFCAAPLHATETVLDRIGKHEAGDGPSVDESEKFIASLPTPLKRDIYMRLTMRASVEAESHAVGTKERAGAIAIAREALANWKKCSPPEDEHKSDAISGLLDMMEHANAPISNA